MDPEGMKPSVTYKGTSPNTDKYKALNHCSVILTKKFSGLYLDDKEFSGFAKCRPSIREPGSFCREAKGMNVYAEV